MILKPWNNDMNLAAADAAYVFTCHFRYLVEHLFLLARLTSIAHTVHDTAWHCPVGSMAWTPAG